MKPSTPWNIITSYLDDTTLAGGSKNPCSFIFDKKYDELRCNPLLKSQELFGDGSRQVGMELWTMGS